jgi:hypothetical protein
MDEVFGCNLRYSSVCQYLNESQGNAFGLQIDRFHKFGVAEKTWHNVWIVLTLLQPHAGSQLLLSLPGPQRCHLSFQLVPEVQAVAHELPPATDAAGW